MATRPASKLNLQELGIPNEIELVDKQGRTDLASLTQRVDDITPPDNIDISEDGVKVYANYDVNELGWGCENKTYYFDTATEFSLGDRTYTKTNAKPAFGGVIGTPGDGQNHAIVLVSTEADATYFSWNNTAHSFDYNGTTWYYCGGTYAYWGSPATGISVIPDKTLSLEDAARYMLDSAQVYVDDGKFSEIAEPNSGYLFAGGGSQDDYSDATFKVSKEGVVTAQDVEINGESITDKIDNIIDDTATDTDTTWSSNKITEEIEDKTSVTKTASGNPIEFTDGSSAPLVKCVTAIQGNQDLHGQMHPWVGGAGKNKLPMTVSGIKSVNTSGTWSGNSYTLNGVTFTILVDNADNVIGIRANGTASGGNSSLKLGSYMVTSDASIMNGCPSGGISSTYRMYIETTSSGTPNWVNDYGDGVTITGRDTGTFPVYALVVNGASVNNIVFYPMIRLSTESDPTFAPYSNICPITAYTEGEIGVRGKNLFDGVIEVGAINPATGEDMPQADRYRAKNYISVYPTHEYIFSKNGTAQPLNISFYGIDKSFVSSTTTVNGKISVPANVWFIRFYYNSDINVQSGLQLEKGSTATHYEPYKGTTHTTTYPSAIYRGSEDVVNGEVTSEMSVIDLGDLTWTYNPTYARFESSGIADMKKGDSRTMRLYSSCYESLWHEESFNIDWNSVIYNGTNDNVANVCVHDHRYTDATAFKTAVTGQMFAYELTTPTTETITPTNLPIKSLFGYNHIESSTGDMEIEYITEEFQPIVDLIQESGGDSHTYSTTEQVVGKWIDDSDVYEVVWHNEESSWTIPASGASGLTIWSPQLPTGSFVISAVASRGTTSHGIGGAATVTPVAISMSNTNQNLDVYQFLSWDFEAKDIIIQYVLPNANRSLSKGVDSKAEPIEEKPEVDSDVDIDSDTDSEESSDNMR